MKDISCQRAPRACPSGPPRHPVLVMSPKILLHCTVCACTHVRMSIRVQICTGSRLSIRICACTYKHPHAYRVCVCVCVLAVKCDKVTHTPTQIHTHATPSVLGPGGEDMEEGSLQKSPRTKASNLVAEAQVPQGDKYMLPGHPTSVDARDTGFAKCRQGLTQ